MKKYCSLKLCCLSLLLILLQWGPENRTILTLYIIGNLACFVFCNLTEINCFFLPFFKGVGDGGQASVVEFSVPLEFKTSLV